MARPGLEPGTPRFSVVSCAHPEVLRFPFDASFAYPTTRLSRRTEADARKGRGPGAQGETPVTVRVAWVWAVTSDRCGWFSGWRRADSRRLCRVPGLTGLACVARRRPRTSGVT
jgi:hypothetical protein